MSALTPILIQQGYLSYEQYQYAYQVQQSDPVELRKPLAQIYIEQGFLGIEHIEYCLSLKHNYLAQGEMPDFSQELATMQQYAQALYGQNQGMDAQIQVTEAGVINCKTCLSECNSTWTVCPFCGSSLK